MPVLLRGGTGNIAHVVATWRRRLCASCGRHAHVTLFSPSMAMAPRFPGANGQCCIRCTRGLRS
jgi:hypothetical protein